MTEKEKAGIITVRLGGASVDQLDQLCLKTFRTRAKQLQYLIGPAGAFEQKYTVPI